MANPYYVEPLGGVNIGQGLVGLGSLMREKKKEDQAYQERLKQQERQTRAQEEMLRVLDSGTPKEMAGFLAEFPEMGDVFKQAYGFTAPQTEGIVKDFGARILATDDPEKAKTAISEMIMAYQDAGVSAPTHTIAAFQELQEGEEGALDRIKKITMGLNSDLRKGFMDQQNKLTSKDKEERIDKIRGEIRKADPDFIKVEDAYGRIVASAEDPSPAGDLALVFNYMKVLDPGSTVREGEFKTAQGAQAALGRAEEEGEVVPNFVKSAVDRLTKGTILLPGQRTDFVNRAGKLYGTAKDKRDKRIAPIRKQIERLQLPEEEIFSQVTEVADPISMPVVGEVRAGYKYTGGDPSLPESWEKQ